MALLFNDGASEYATYAGAVVAAPPLTMACWALSDDDAANQCLLSIGSSITTDRYVLEALGGVGGDPLRAFAEGTAFGGASTSTGFTEGTWFHAAAVFSATNARAVYLNGAGKGTDTVDVTVSSPNRTSIGTSYSPGLERYMSGRIAAAAIWSAALSDAEIAALALGLSPHRMRPGSLVDYWPLWGLHSPEISATAGGHAMTLVGPVAANHPAIAALHYPPSAPDPTSVATAGILRQMMNYHGA